MLRYGSVGLVCSAAGLYVGMEHHDKLQIACLNAGLYLKSLGPSSSSSLGVRRDPLSSVDNYMHAAVEVTNSLKFGVLSTAHPVTSVASRTIQPFEVEFDAQGNPEIYFNTNKHARKVTQLQTNHDVALAYLDQNRMCCVTYTGRCERVPYPQSTRHWRDWLWVIYPEGNDESQGSRFTTWRVKPHTINYVNLSEGVVSSRFDGRPPEIVLPAALPPSDPMHVPGPAPIVGQSVATSGPTSTIAASSVPPPPTHWRFRDYGADVADRPRK